MIKVRTVPVQPFCFLYGGFDIQMGRTHEALQSVGVDAKPLDWWSRDEQFDILHVWGLTIQHHGLVRIAKDYGKKVVMTPILTYLTPLEYLRHCYGFIRGYNKAIADMLRCVDVLLVVNKLQAVTAMKLYRFPSQSIEVIPTMLDPLFFNAKLVVSPHNDLKDYIVCAGNILPRKNQIRLAKAALQIGCSIIFIGNAMGGEISYAKAFQKIVDASPSIKWYKWVSWEKLFQIMSSARAIAIPSFNECQPASALEAVALQKPLLIAQRPYAFQEFYTGALMVNPKSIDSIANGLKEILANPRQYTPSRFLINECRPDVIGLKLRQIFERLLSV